MVGEVEELTIFKRLYSPNLFLVNNKVWTIAMMELKVNLFSMSKCIIFSYKGRCRCRDELHLKWGHFIFYKEVMLRHRFVLLKEFHPYYIIYCIFGLFYFREDGRDPILSTQATSATIIIYKFHIECLPLWEDFTCPVFWYVHTPEVVTD